jgi:hypothetical protein
MDGANNYGISTEYLLNVFDHGTSSSSQFSCLSLKSRWGAVHKTFLLLGADIKASGRCNTSSEDGPQRFTESTYHQIQGDLMLSSFT